MSQKNVTQKGRTVALSEEDRARLARLHEEAYSRLLEVSLIISRSLGQGVQPSNFRFETTQTSSESQEVEGLPKEELTVNKTKPRVAKVYIRSGGGCYCYDYENQECYEVPLNDCE